MARRLKDVCFTKSDGSRVAFGATKTSSACSREDRAQYVKKDVAADELRALMLLDDTGVTPQVLGYNRLPRNKFRVYMQKTGTSLDELPSAQRVVSTAAFEEWIRGALEKLRQKGVRHLDLSNGAKRNITYHPRLGFRIIDFGRVDFSSNWSVRSAVNEVLRRVRR